MTATPTWSVIRAAAIDYRMNMRSEPFGGILGILLLAACAWMGAQTAVAADFVRDSYYWYVPEHEKYSRTEFFSQPDFRSSQVRINRTQRFRYGPGRRGWVELELDGGMKAYIHVRILRTLLHDPGAIDPWYEFQRASVFAEEPAKIEARLRPARTEPSAADSKVPIWKRYKEGWSINKSRTVSPSETNTDPEAATTRAPEKRGRSRYPLLPPIGSEPPAEPVGSSEPATEPGSSGSGSR
jgi:hypothetical protein